MYHATELDRYIERAIAKRGFSVVEAVSYCHTTFGRSNGFQSPVAMMQHLKDQSTTLQAAERADDELEPGTIIRGVLHDADYKEFIEQYDEAVAAEHGTPPPRRRRVRRGWL